MAGCPLRSAGAYVGGEYAGAVVAVGMHILRDRVRVLYEVGSTGQRKEQVPQPSFTRTIKLY